MSEHTLYRTTVAGVGLAEALDAFAPKIPEATALLYSPARCQLLRFQDGRLHGSSGGEIDLRAVFEARVFSQDGELRWLHEAAGLGRASFVSESPAQAESGDVHEQPCIDRLEHGYLLWGNVQSAEGGWARMALARVGSFDVPSADAQPGARLRLKAVEHLARGKHGNTYICDERLIGLEVV